jgi:hypothetical protein
LNGHFELLPDVDPGMPGAQPTNFGLDLHVETDHRFPVHVQFLNRPPVTFVPLDTAPFIFAVHVPELADSAPNSWTNSPEPLPTTTSVSGGRVNVDVDATGANGFSPFILVIDVAPPEIESVAVEGTDIVARFRDNRGIQSAVLLLDGVPLDIALSAEGLRIPTADVGDGTRTVNLTVVDQSGFISYLDTTLTIEGENVELEDTELEPGDDGSDGNTTGGKDQPLPLAISLGAIGIAAFARRRSRS